MAITTTRTTSVYQAASTSTESLAARRRTACTPMNTDAAAKNAASASAARCSALPCPNGWSRSGGRTATRTANSVSSAATRSVPECSASAIRPREPDARPAPSLTATSTTAAKTETSAVRCWPFAAPSMTGPTVALDHLASVVVPDRPTIGLCLTHSRARYGFWEEDTVLLSRDYVRAVQRAGALPLLFAPDPVSTERPDEVLDLVDGLVLAGGVDVGDDPERDAFEMALARRALERDLPLLGVCRGMQVMNVAGGGTLIEHVPDVVGHEEHRHTMGTYADHVVTLDDGSLAARA